MGFAILFSFFFYLKEKSGKIQQKTVSNIFRCIINKIVKYSVSILIKRSGTKPRAHYRRILILQNGHVKVSRQHSYNIPTKGIKVD